MVPIVCIILTVLIPRMSLTSRFSLHQLSSSALTAWKYSSKYCTYIHCPLRLNTDHFNVPLLYLTIVWIAIDLISWSPEDVSSRHSLYPDFSSPAGFHLTSELSHDVPDALARNVVPTLMVPLG